MDDSPLAGHRAHQSGESARHPEGETAGLRAMSFDAELDLSNQRGGGRFFRSEIALCAASHRGNGGGGNQPDAKKMSAVLKYGPT